MERWSGRQSGVMRAQAWDDHLDRQATSATTKAVREMNERQAAIGVRLQAKAVEGLQVLPAGELSAGDVTKLADTGAKLERLARGEATEREGDAGSDAENLATDPELADAAHEFLRWVAERRLGEGDTPTPTEHAGEPR
jgi:hypothetical protein